MPESRSGSREPTKASFVPSGDHSGQQSPGVPYGTSGSGDKPRLPTGVPSTLVSTMPAAKRPLASKAVKASAGSGAGDAPAADEASAAASAAEARRFTASAARQSRSA